jgi:polyhydroxyalkanoate synthesis regulator phasin
MRSLTVCDDLYKNEFEAKLAKAERKWEFRYQQQWKKQKELEETIDRLRQKIRELKNG